MPSGVSALGYNYNLIVIGGDPLFDELPEGLDGLENYDPALLRRIQRHIQFRLPDSSMRRELHALHLPNPDRVRADYAVLADLSRGLSGRDILNICLNAIYAGSADVDSEKWKVTQGMLEREIAKAKKAKTEHVGEKGKSRKRIGFQSS